MSRMSPKRWSLLTILIVVILKPVIENSCLIKFGRTLFLIYTVQVELHKVHSHGC